MIKNFKSGFTLVELLVVISILAILSVMGIAAYSGVVANSRDSRKKADVDAIANAFEVNYDKANQKYVALAPNHFSNGKIPTPPEGGSYTCVKGPDSSSFSCTSDTADDDEFLVCTTIKDYEGTCTETSSDQCYCRSSVQ